MAKNTTSLVWGRVAEDVGAAGGIPPEHRTYRARIDGGWLVETWAGTGHGQWGGGLAFVPDVKTKQSPRAIMRRARTQ